MERPKNHRFAIDIGDIRLAQLRRFAVAEQMTVEAMIQRLFDNGFEKLVPSDRKPFIVLPKTVNPTDVHRARRSFRVPIRATPAG